MADKRKEFEMAFKLSAQLNSSYKGTFKEAQSAVASIQKEIGILNKTQSDISAYQKQQAAVEATEKKLAALQQQYDNIQKEIKETKGVSSDLENKLISKQQQIDKTTSSLGKQEEKLRQMGTALQQTGIDTGNLTSESQRLEAEMQELKSRQEAAADSAQEFGSKSEEAINTISSAIAAAGIAKALKEIADAYVECISVAGEFEETMSTVEALSGANAREMESLSGLAKQMGAETKYTAQESAEAMTYMAMAGWQTSDMLQGLDGVIQLAAASGEDLAMTSDIVTDNLTAFGMSAAETARFADVLAATATNSNTSVSVMGETFKQSASIAGALGYSIEDVSVAVGLMANSGIKGSIAGTALKNTFNGLLDGVTLTGVKLGEYEFTALKADGTMKTFSETINELRGCFEQLSPAEKTSNAMALAGQRGYNGLLAIINATDKDYNSLTESINNCSGAASRMASIKLDNMNGQLKLAQSAWEGVTIAVGEQFTPEMTKVYKIAADVFSKLKEFIEKHPALIKAGTAFVAVIGSAVGGLTAFAAITKVIKLLNIASLFTGPVGIILAAVAGVAALTAAIVGMVESANEGVPTVKELTEAARDMDESMSQAAENYNAASINMTATASVAETYIARLEEIEAATNGNVAENQEYHNILELLIRKVPELSNSIDLQTNSIEGGTEALRRQTEAWKQNAEKQAQQEYLNSLYDEYSAVMTEAAENSIKLTQAQTQERVAVENYNKAVARMEEIWGEAEAAAQKYSEETGQATNTTYYLTEEYQDLSNSLKTYEDEMKKARKEQENLKKAVDADNEAVAAAEEVITSAESAIESLTKAEREQAEAAAQIAEQESEIALAVGSVSQEAESLTGVYQKLYDSAYTSVSGQYGLWDEAAKVTQKSVADINSAMESQVSYWQDYNANLQLLSGRSEEIAGLSGVIASFADGSQESVNAIAGMANASDEELQKMVKNWEELQEQQNDVAANIADVSMEFTQQMDALGQELAEDIEAMNLETEVAEAGKATIQGFIDGAGAMTSQVENAYASIASQALAALNTAGNSGSIRNRKERGYASGTTSAEPGFAMVGENGPELIFMNGGEKVLNAAETANIKQELSSRDMNIQAVQPQLQAAYAQSQNIVNAQNSQHGGYTITVHNSNTVHVDGGKTEDLEAQLERIINIGLAQRIEDVLNRIADNERRSAYV